MATSTLRRFGLLFVAWAVGWLVYMVFMVMTVYEGILSLIFQPIMAAIVSAFFVGVAILTRKIFPMLALGRLWCSSRWLAIGLAATSIFLMLFGYSLGLTQIYTNPATGSKYVGLNYWVGLSCYFFLIFSIANFPPSKENSAPVV